MTSKKPAMIAAVAACLCLVAAVLLGLDDAVVWPLALFALVAVGGLIYLTRRAGN